jgi:hypothetical protein
MSKIRSASGRAKCWWFNPRDGSVSLIGTFANTGTRDFTPSDSNDWVLVIDDANANPAAPEALTSENEAFIALGYALQMRVRFLLFSAGSGKFPAALWPPWRA